MKMLLIGIVIAPMLAIIVLAAAVLFKDFREGYNEKKGVK